MSWLGVGLLKYFDRLVIKASNRVCFYNKLPFAIFITFVQLFTQVTHHINAREQTHSQGVRREKINA